MMAFCPEHLKWDQNPKFTPLRETTSIPTTFMCGILEQYLGFGEQLSVTKPDPVQDKKFLKYKPGLGQHPKFYNPV